MNNKIYRTFTKDNRDFYWLSLAIEVMQEDAEEQSLIMYRAHTYIADPSSARFDHLTDEKSMDYVILPCR